MMRSLLITLFMVWCSSQVLRADINPLMETFDRYAQVTVARVLSVSVVLLENDEKVSLVGIAPQAPVPRKEVKRDVHGFIIPEDDPTTPVQVESFRSVQGLVEGKKVRLEFDVSRRDDAGLRTAYIFLPDGKMLNEEILRNGYADLRLRAPNVKHAEQLRKAYQEARREMRGLQGEW